jgi:hypothetical protein
MISCEPCQHWMPDGARFCDVCGRPVMMQAPTYPQQFWPAGPYPASHSAPAQYLLPPPPQERGLSHNHLIARGVAQTFGLHPAMAFLTVVVNTMAFATGVIIPGAWLASIPVGMVIALIVYMGQMKWYDDDHESAIIKALIVGFLTAIPTSLPGYLTIPAGVIGIFRKK